MDASMASAYDGMELCEYEMVKGKEADISRGNYNQIIDCGSYQHKIKR